MDSIIIDTEWMPVFPRCSFILKIMFDFGKHFVKNYHQSVCYPATIILVETHTSCHEY
jgi:hypothetical protein